MKKVILILFFMAFLLGNLPQKAHAQESACPDGEAIPPNPPLSVGTTVGGGYPSDLEACILIAGSGGSSFLSLREDPLDIYPCSQYLYLNYNAFTIDTDWNAEDYSFYFAWPDDKESEDARVRLYFWLPQIVGSVAPPAPIQGNWYVRYFTPSGTPVNGVNGAISGLATYSLRVSDGTGLVRFTNLYYLDVTFTTTHTTSETAYGGLFQFVIQRTIGEPFPYDIMLSSPQIDVSDAVFPVMCSFDAAPISTSTPTPTGVWSTPTPGVPGATAPAAATSTPRPWPTETTRPYVTLIPEPMATQILIPTLAPITFPTISWPTVPTVLVTATPSPSVPTPTAGPTVQPLATLNTQIEALATEWAQPIGLANNYIVSPTEVISGYTVSSASAELIQTIALPFRLFKTAQLYSPSTWPLYAMALVSIVVVLSVHILRFALAIFFFVFEVFRRLWEMLPLN